MAEQTLDGLAAILARRFGMYVSGLATSGTTTSLSDTTTLIQPTDIWNNDYLRILSGANSGLERLIDSFTSPTLTFDALPVAVAAGVSYEVGPLQRADIVMAVQGAIDRAGTNWMKVVDDDTGTFSVGVQDYALPADLVSLLAVYVWTLPGGLPGGNVAGEWQPLSNYEVVGTPGARKLLMRGWAHYPMPPAGTVSYQRRIRYLAMPTRLSSGAATLGLGDVAERQALAFLQEYALYLLNDMQFNRNRTGEMARAFLSAKQAAYSAAMQIMSERDARREQRYMRGMQMGRQV